MHTSIMQSRPIPSTGEPLPVIGCGTYVAFDHPPDSGAYQGLPGVVSALRQAGGTVIDSSPMYGRAETTAGEILSLSGYGADAFLATKVWISGRESGIRQMERSLERLKVARIDLMQIHNLLDWKTQLQTLKEWKDSGRTRYIGITHYTSSAYGDVEHVLRTEQLDFVQINYSMDDREAAKRILPLAADRGVAVLVNMPFGGGGLLSRTRDRPLPVWASEIGCKNWAQVLLKFTLSHPAVTCVIPGSSDEQHMRSNASAGAGAIPPQTFWVDKILTRHA